MGCQGSKPAEMPKSEDNTAAATLLRELGADSKAAKSEEPQAEGTATQGSATETAAKGNVADAVAEKVEQSPTAPADAKASKAEMTVEAEEAPKPPPDAARTNPGEVKTEEMGFEEASATAQASNEEKTTALSETPIVPEGAVAEKVLAADAPEVDAVVKAEVAEVAVSVATANAPVAGQQGGCFKYCIATESETEIVVQN